MKPNSPWFSILALSILNLAVPACTDSSSSPTGPDAMPVGSGGGGGGGGGQRVLECSGTLSPGGASMCPAGECDETSASDVVACTRYGDVVPGSTQGLCTSGETGSYGLLFGTKPGALSSYYYQVVVCNAGTPTVHACASGFTTDPQGNNGQPGYVCTH